MEEIPEDTSKPNTEMHNVNPEVQVEALDTDGNAAYQGVEKDTPSNKADMDNIM